MRANRTPGRPLSSTAPRKPPRRIAPAKLAAKFRADVTKQKEVRQTRKRQERSAAVIKHLEELQEAQRKKKAGPSALDPLANQATPMQATKGETKNKLARLLQLSALAVMSHPFGAQLASWTTGVAADCGAEWTKEAVDLAVARGPHLTAATPDATELVHGDISYQEKAGFTEVVCWDEIKDDLPEHFKVSPDRKTRTHHPGHIVPRSQAP